MNWKVTVGMLVVAVLLGSYVFLNEAQKPAPTPTPLPGLSLPTPVAMNTFVADDVISLAIRSPEGATQLVRPPTGGDWLMTQPRPSPADQVRVGGIVAQVASLNSISTLSLDGGRPASEYGLDPARVTVTVGKKDNTTEELTIGDQSPVGDGYYARKNKGNTVFIVNMAAVDALQRLVTEPAYPAAPTPVPQGAATPGVAGITPAPAR